MICQMHNFLPMKKNCYLLLLLLLPSFNLIIAQSSTVTSRVNFEEPKELVPSYFGPIEVHNLEELNSKELEMCPMPFQNGLVFTATYSKTMEKGPEANQVKRYTDLYYTQVNKDGGYDTPVSLAGTVNGPLHDGMACFTADGKYMYFTRNNKNGKAEDGVVDLKICRAEWTGNEWGNIIDLPFNSKSYSNCHPSLSADGKKMYFASNRPGGQGGMDIYVAKMEKGKWQRPVNLGETINTDKNEIFPFAGPDGNFYFASDGHPGKGGLDIFLSLGPEMGDWGRVENLGLAFNSPSDDFGFVCTAKGDEGYFSSSRAGGKGRDDIYEWKLRSEEVLTRNTVIDAEKAKLAAERQSLSELMAAEAAEAERLASRGVEARVSDDESFFFSDDDWAKTTPSNNVVTTQWSKKKTNDSNGIPPDNLRSVTVKNTPATTPRSGTDGVWSTKIEMTRAGDNSAQDQTANEMQSLSDLMETVEKEWAPQGVTSSTSNSTLSTKVEWLKNNTGTNPNLNGNSRTTGPVSANTSKAAGTTVYTPIPVNHIEETETNTESIGKTNEMLKVGEVFRLDNIYYDFDQATLRPESLVELNKLALLMQQYPGMEITIMSHTDAKGDATYNFDLSQRRAESVINYLVSRQISRQRFKARGYGEYRPINACPEGVECSEVQHAQNRRTEFQLDRMGSTYVPVADPSHTGGQQKLLSWQR